MPTRLDEGRRLEQELTELSVQLAAYRRALALTPAEALRADGTEGPKN